MRRPDTGPVPEKTITEKEVKDWLRKASLRELNIFTDKNAFIVLLCRALLRAWKELGWDEDRPDKPCKK